MLTREMALAQFDFRHGRLVPDRLTRVTHAAYLGHADRMLLIYRRGLGRTRRELHQAVEGILANEEACPARRIRAFCKLLDDVSRYDEDRRGGAADLRLDVFRRAARFHPLVAEPDQLFEHSESRVKAAIAANLGRSWEQIERDLFADVLEYQRLVEFDSYPDGAALLARYNVAQVQAALYDAESLTIWARQDFKSILRYAKLAGLMHSISKVGNDQYRIRLDGPASILRETRRYGVAMARFLPGLLSCRGWRMHAVLKVGRSGLRLHFDLSDADGLTSPVAAPADFDSDIEEKFAQRWGSEPRSGWRLIREGEVLWQGQRVFIPDFVFEHETGRRVLFEIVGFWTPEYLEAKLGTLREFREARVLLAVAAAAEGVFRHEGADVLVYKTAIKVNEVLERLERLSGDASRPSAARGASSDEPA